MTPCLCQCICCMYYDSFCMVSCSSIYYFCHSPSLSLCNQYLPLCLHLQYPVFCALVSYHIITSTLSSLWYRFFRQIQGAYHCPACRTSLIATRFWVVVICPIIKCLTVLEVFFILFDLCLFIIIFNFILNYVPIVTFWIFTYHKIWILLIIFCFIWNCLIIYFLTCLEVFWSVVS